MKNYLHIDNKIDQNLHRLEFYYSNHHKTQSKISILAIMYSLISIYIFQVIKYPFTYSFETNEFSTILYILVLIGLFIFLIWSIKFIYLLLKPVEIAYINQPEFFYKNIKEDYEKSLMITDENTLNLYIKETYLKELEQSVKHNYIVFKEKSNYYNIAFIKGLTALFLYMVCTGFVVFEPEKPKEFNLKNYQEIINIIKKEQKMAEKKQTPKVDPSKVIITKPVMIKENFSLQERSNKNDTNAKKKK
jgi:hypothetical protein